MNNKHWKYKDHRCSIEIDMEDDNMKAFHEVALPPVHSLPASVPKQYGNMVVTPPLTPYDDSKALVEAWIDAGYPASSGGNFMDVAEIRKFVLLNAGKFSPSVMDVEWTRSLLAKLRVGGVWGMPGTASIVTKNEDRKFTIVEPDRSVSPESMRHVREMNGRVVRIMREFLNYEVVQ